jgi:hypothetical protein
MLIECGINDGERKHSSEKGCPDYFTAGRANSEFYLGPPFEIFPDEIFQGEFLAIFPWSPL